MGHDREKPSTFSTRLAHRLGGKQRPAIGRSAVPQTSPSTSPRVTPVTIPRRIPLIPCVKPGFENQVAGDPPDSVAQNIPRVIQKSARSQGDDDYRPPLPSGFVAACPRLTELTIFPYPYSARIPGMEIMQDQAGKAFSALLELVFAYRELPDFDTIQISCFPALEP